MYPANVYSLHLELSDKCQASCPMCPRNSFGGPEREHITNTEISFEQFKEWFPPSFLKNIWHVMACGNNGDPLMAKDLFEIYEYLRQHCPSEANLDIYTNGSLRNKEWWAKLAKVLGKQGKVVFAIDGLADTHSIYRRGTVFEKIIENAQAFINAGGRAVCHSIVFKHNEHQSEEIEKLVMDMGFESIEFKATNRFYGLDNFPVKNRKGEFEYYLNPAEGPRWNVNLPKPNWVRLVKKDEYDKMLTQATIDAKCLKGSNLYINSQGHVYPCCWVGSMIDNDKYVEIQTEAEGILRDRITQSAVDLVNDIKMIDLNKEVNIEVALANSGWGEKMEKHVTTEPKLICVKSCASNFVDIIK